MINKVCFCLSGKETKTYLGLESLDQFFLFHKLSYDYDYDSSVVEILECLSEVQFIM